MSRWKFWEWLVFVIVLALIVWATMGIGLAVFGPHYPPKPLDPRKEFVDSCEYRNGIPDVHTDRWSCQRVME